MTVDHSVHSAEAGKPEVLNEPSGGAVGGVGIRSVLKAVVRF
jgi:hypothetical protein